MLRLLLILFISGLFFSFGQFESSAASSLKLLSLNMWSVPGQRKLIFARSEAVGRKLAKKDYDLVLFQEVFTRGVRTTLLYHIGRGYEDRYQRTPFPRLNSGLFNLSKFEITKTGFMPFRSCGGLQCLSKKGILYMQVKLPEGELVDIFNLHAQALALTPGTVVRSNQFTQMRSYIDKKNDGTIPVIIVGDFNVDGNSQEYGVFQQTLYDFKDVWNEMNLGQPGYTWDPTTNYWAADDWIDDTGPQRLDYIWIRDGKKHSWSIDKINISFAKKIPWWGSGLNPKTVLASDHYGLEATLQLNSVE